MHIHRYEYNKIINDEHGGRRPTGQATRYPADAPAPLGDR